MGGTCTHGYFEYLDAHMKVINKFDTLGRILKSQDGSEDYIFTEWDSNRNIGRETMITPLGKIIDETQISRETYNWAVNRGAA